MLYERADNSDSVIVNLHSTTSTSHRVKCHQEYVTTNIMIRLGEEPDPHCHRKPRYHGDVPCSDIIKTDVVYFGEALPDGAMEKSCSLATKADELQAIGSTPEVYPVASIIPAAAQAGIPITITNMGHTQHDHLASCLIHEGIVVAPSKLVDETIAESE